VTDTLESRGASGQGPRTTTGGGAIAQSDVSDPGDNVVEVWDFFARGPIDGLPEHERFDPRRTG
jgi:hypothetical protein